MAKQKQPVPSEQQKDKAAGSSSAGTKLTPRQLREAQDRRNRNIVVGILSVLLVVLLVVLGVLIYKAKSGGGSSPATGASQDVTSSVVVGAEGAGKPTEGVPTVDFYYSYGCPACIQIEHAFSEDFQKGIKDGKYNLNFFPVGTHGLPWTYVAGYASMQVAQKQPEKFVDFHQALIEFGNSVMFKDAESAKQQGNGTVLAEADGSLAEVKRIAGEVGVTDEIISAFVSADQAKPTVDGWSDKWVDTVSSIVEKDRIGTPMFVKGDKRLSASDYFPQDEETTSELKKLQESDPAKYQQQVQELSDKAYREMIADFGN